MSFSRFRRQINTEIAHQQLHSESVVDAHLEWFKMTPFISYAMNDIDNNRDYEKKERKNQAATRGISSYSSCIASKISVTLDEWDMDDDDGWDCCQPTNHCVNQAATKRNKQHFITYLCLMRSNSPYDTRENEREREKKNKPKPPDTCRSPRWISHITMKSITLCHVKMGGMLDVPYREWF